MGLTRALIRQAKQTVETEGPDPVYLVQKALGHVQNIPTRALEVCASNLEVFEPQAATHIGVYMGVRFAAESQLIAMLNRFANSRDHGVRMEAMALSRKSMEHLAMVANIVARDAADVIGAKLDD